MARPATTTDSFFQLPQTQRLLEIARSDNSLIALAVQRREISWTQAMASLLDPNRVVSDTARERTASLIQIALSKLPGQNNTPDAGPLVQLGGRKLDSVLEVVPEQSLGKAGRVDLVILGQTGGDIVRLLIENKIDASEHADQLSGYVAHYQRKHPSDLLLPILIDLGDTPAEQATCPWAPCLYRSHIATWLAGMQDAPTVARDYLGVFEAWDIGASLRKQHQSDIDRLRSSKNPPREWGLIASWMMDDGRSFYQAAFGDTVLVNALTEHGFLEPESMGRLKGENSILVLTKPGWTIDPCGADRPGVQVHFECDGRGRLRMDVGLYPYEGSVGKKPDRMAALAAQLELKASLHEVVREELTRVQMPVGVSLDQRGLRAMDSPRANSAGRFVRDAGEDCTAQEYADFIASVIVAVAPIIDTIVAPMACSATPTAKP